MNYILIVIVLVLVLVIVWVYNYYATTTKESFVNGDKNISQFDNFCLTPKPRGRYDPTCSIWKDIPNITFPYKQRVPYPKEFSDNTNNSPVHFQSYCQDYYLNSSAFCQKNPKHRLCPNHWLY